MLECCEREAESRFRTTFPQEKKNELDRFRDYLLKLAARWGPIPQTVASGFAIRTVDEVGFVSARILPITCLKGHKSDLVVLGKRLYFFIWRVNMLMADYWTVDKTGDLVGKYPDQAWPTDTALNELDRAVHEYLGEESLTLTFQDLNQMFDRSHPISQLMYVMAVDMSELFVLFHELLHVIPAPPGLRVNIEMPAAGTTNFRPDWIHELQADANAEFLLWVTATAFFNDVFKIPLVEAKKAAAVTVFYGADAALDALRVLEQIDCGEISVEAAVSHPSFHKHPPASYRRDFLSNVSRTLILNGMDKTSWDEIANNMASMIEVRQRLYDKFFALKPASAVV
jgi:hypothetical protein